MNLDSLKDVMIDGLKDLYNAENLLVKALPKVAKAASSAELKTAFTEHLDQTRGHVERLDVACKKLGVNPKGKTCHAMKGLIKEGQDVIDEDGEPAAKDAALIAAAQKVEHYEIAGYGCVRTFANLLGETEIGELMQQTLDEESNADKKLTQIAEAGLNQEAAESEQIRGESRGANRAHTSHVHQ